MSEALFPNQLSVIDLEHRAEKVEVRRMFPCPSQKYYKLLLTVREISNFLKLLSHVGIIILPFFGK